MRLNLHYQRVLSVPIVKVAVKEDCVPVNRG